VTNWRRVVDINISGVFYGVRVFLPKMMATDEQAWVWNLSSVGGVLAIPLQGPYIMSKHAVLALTECLYLDVQSAGHQHHIHVQAVLPGAVVSNIFESAGGVDPHEGSDVAVVDAQRSAMLDIKAGAMDPSTAAATVFEQAARAGSTCSASRSMLARPWQSGRICLLRNGPRRYLVDDRQIAMSHRVDNRLAQR
jgi:NAD(P)-dependent dehydrogenase (short-subunit alcohol dehydrogenase family)